MSRDNKNLSSPLNFLNVTIPIWLKYYLAAYEAFEVNQPWEQLNSLL